MSLWRRAALGLAATLVSTAALAAEPVSVTAREITRFKGASLDAPVDRLIFRGGLVLSGDHRDFGGLSGLAFLDARRFVMVTDEGRFVSGVLDLGENGQPLGFSDVLVAPINNSSGDPLPTRFSRDAEAVAVIFREGMPSVARVGFEHLTRIADFDLVDGRPGGAARSVSIPDWLTGLRGNEAIESVCIAPPASPVGGSTLVVTEGHEAAPGQWAGTLLGQRDRGDLTLMAAPGYNPTDCAFLPDGDLLVLERGFFLVRFSMQIRRIPADLVRAGAVMDGPVLISAAGAEIDNMEGLGVRVLPNGEIRITVVSDNNFNGVQRNLLLDFALPE